MIYIHYIEEFKCVDIYMCVCVCVCEREMC